MKIRFIASSALVLGSLAAGLSSGTIVNSQNVRARTVGEPSATNTPTPRPMITPVMTPPATPSTVQTLEHLQSRIRQQMFAPAARRGRVGIKITVLNSGKTVFENDSDKYFMPASNMKNFTVAAALERLTPDFRFVTSVYADARPDAGGTIRGPLRIYGRGDISISNSFSNGDPFKGLDDLADRIKQAGVVRIEGDLIGDESYFKGFAIPSTWEWDDLQWYYGAEVSALPVNDNAIQLSVRPGPSGYQCSVKLDPPTQLIQIVNRCMTTGRRDLKVTKKLDANIIEISGSLPVGDDGFTGRVTVSRPAELFVALLKERLALKGITVTGSARTTAMAPIVAAAPPVEIARLESPPFGLIAAKTMKPSQNMYTEVMLWTLGERFGRPASPDADSSALGLAAAKSFYKQIGIADDAVVQHDGSGMSRRDLVTPSAVVTLYTYMAKQSRYSQAWRDSLTIGGVDGTLGRRFKGTAAVANFRGKTGTLDQVSALSGYVTTAASEQLVVSIIVNGVPALGDRLSLIDEIVVSLANFNGRIDTGPGLAN